MATLQPSGVGEQATFTVNGISGIYAVATTILFNGVQEASGSGMYWSDNTHYIDITIDSNCNIWALPNTDYATTEYNKLGISIYQNESWVDITSTTTQYARSNASSATWKNIFPNLPKGRYKFFYNGNQRHDGEWFIEKVIINKYLIQDGDNLYSIKPSFYSDTNAIPVMTSNTTPIGIASASSISSTYDAWKAFNGTTDFWMSANSTVPMWLCYNFGNGNNKIIAKYSINCVSINSSPKDWTFEGSSDGTNWTILDTQSNITNWVVGESNTYICNNTTLYQYYRINISSVQGISKVQLNKFKMFELILGDVLSSYSVTSKDTFVNKGMDNIKDVIDGTYKLRALGSTNETIDNGKLFSFPLNKDFGSFKELK